MGLSYQIFKIIQFLTNVDYNLPEKADYYTIKGFSKFIVDFLERIGIKEDKEHNNKISVVGYSLGGHIAAEVAIEIKR